MTLLFNFFTDLWNLIPCKINSMQWHLQFYDEYAIFSLRTDELFLSKRWLSIFTWIPMLESRLESMFLLWYSSHFTEKLLSVYHLKCSSLVMRFFFQIHWQLFLFFPKYVQSCQLSYACQHLDIYLIKIAFLDHVS